MALPLVGTRHHTIHCTWANPARMAVVCLFHQEGYWSPEKLRNLTQATQLVNQMF